LLIAALVPCWFIAMFIVSGIAQALRDPDVLLACAGGPAAIAGALLVALDVPRSRLIAFVLILPAVAGPIAMLANLQHGLHGGEIFLVAEAAFGILGLLTFAGGLLWERRRGAAGAAPNPR
jgi:hypothetical protein